MGNFFKVIQCHGPFGARRRDIQNYPWFRPRAVPSILGALGIV